MNTKWAACCALGTLLATIQAASAQPVFTAGNLVVVTYGSTTANSYIDGNPVPLTLLQFSPAIAPSSPISSFQIPTTANGANVGIVGEYGSSSEGNIQLSGDGHLLTVAGYNAQQAANGIGASSNSANGTNAPIGTPYSNAAGIPLAQSTDTDVNRAAVFIDAFGNVNSSSTFSNLFSTNNPRSVYSDTGASFYFSGQGSGTSDQGLYFVAVAGTQNQKTAIYNTLDTRFTQVFNGNLYYSIDKKGKATGIFKYTGEPTSLTTATQITPATAAGANLSPEGFYFANATTLYIADTGVPKNGGTSLGGIQKWTFNGSTWSLLYTFPNPSNFVSRSSGSSASHGETGFAAIAGTVNNGVASIYGVSYTAGDADANGLYGITDTVVATTLGGQTFTEIAAAPGVHATGTTPDYSFKGLSFAPSTPVSVPANDTPAMPTWLLVTLGVILLGAATRFLPAQTIRS